MAPSKIVAISHRKFDAVKTNSFNSHSVRSVLITKLRNKLAKTTNLDYKMDIDSDSNLMSVNMFKTLFQGMHLQK